MSNLKNIVLIFQENPIARSYLKLFKYHTDQNFYHIHHGYLKKVRGADATLHSIDKFNEIGASFFKMDKKIDNGKIIKKFKKNTINYLFQTMSNLKMKTYIIFGMLFLILL